MTCHVEVAVWAEDDVTWTAQTSAASADEVVHVLSGRPIVSQDFVGIYENIGADATDDYNLKLSLRRAEAIKDALLSLGARPEDIVLAGQGETQPAVATPDNVREAANRRVEIVIQ